MLVRKPDGYLVAGEINNGRKMILMHQLISGKKYQDHINGNKMDDRKDNLRDATHSQNNMNKGIQKNNTSGTTGVVFDKRRNKWCAQIKINKKNIRLGYYIDKNNAIKARKEAEEKYFGEFAYKGQL